MDEFLIPNANFKRLYEEYKKFGSLSVYTDFDNTIYDFHKKGYKYPVVIQLLKDCVERGMKICVFTANESPEFVLKHMEELGIPHEGINVDIIKLGWECRKPFYNILLDDRAGLISAVEDLRKLIDTLEEEEWYARPDESLIPINN